MIQVFIKRLDGPILNLLLLKAVSVDVKTSNQPSHWQLGWGRLHGLILSLSPCRTLV